MNPRVIRRPRLFLILAGAALAAACSGTPADKANLGLNASARLPDETGTTPPPAGDIPAAPAGPDGSDTPGEPTPKYDAGAPVVLDAGPEYEGGVPCVQGGVLEVEPNDDASTANELAPTVCGALIPGTEVDVLKFKLQSKTKSMFIGFDGNVSLTVAVDGQTVVVTPQSHPSIPFVKGKYYFVEVRSMDHARQNYRVTIFES